jgi:hypothetical protein
MLYEMPSYQLGNILPRLYHFYQGIAEDRIPLVAAGVPIYLLLSNQGLPLSGRCGETSLCAARQ